MRGCAFALPSCTPHSQQTEHTNTDSQWLSGWPRSPLRCSAWSASALLCVRQRDTHAEEETSERVTFVADNGHVLLFRQRSLTRNRALPSHASAQHIQHINTRHTTSWGQMSSRVVSRMRSTMSSVIYPFKVAFTLRYTHKTTHKHKQHSRSNRQRSSRVERGSCAEVGGKGNHIEGSTQPGVRCWVICTATHPHFDPDENRASKTVPIALKRFCVTPVQQPCVGSTRTMRYETRNQRRTTQQNWL